MPRTRKPSFLNRLYNILTKEFYIGGEEFHRKYAFLMALLVCMPVLSLMAFGLIFQEHEPLGIMSCLAPVPAYCGLLALGGLISGFHTRGKVAWLILLCFAGLGLLAGCTWLALRLCGWPAPYGSHGVQGEVWWLLVVTSWTWTDFLVALALWKRR